MEVDADAENVPLLGVTTPPDIQECDVVRIDDMRAGASSIDAELSQREQRALCDDAYRDQLLCVPAITQRRLLHSFRRRILRPLRLGALQLAIASPGL